MNVSARGVFKKSKIIEIGLVEIFLERFAKSVQKCPKVSEIAKIVASLVADSILDSVTNIFAELLM